MATSSRIYLQSAVIPAKRTNNEIHILLITNTSKKRWVIPKGLIESGLNSMESAEKEAWEEAGVTGNTFTKPVGHFQYTKWRGVCQVEVFFMKVKNEYSSWPESETRKRRWFRLQELPFSSLKKEIAKFFHDHYIVLKEFAEQMN